MATNDKRPDSKTRRSSRSDTTDGIDLKMTANQAKMDKLRTGSSVFGEYPTKEIPWENHPWEAYPVLL